MTFLQWHGENDILEIGPFKLQGPLVYSTTEVDCDERSAIYQPKRFRMPVLNAADAQWRNNPYQMMYGYRMMGSMARLQYLEWLQNGRPAADAHPFLPLYIQGLERRIVSDRTDALVIWNELWRLRLPPQEEWYLMKAHIDRFLWYLLPQVGAQAEEKQIATLARSVRQISQWDPDPKNHLSLLLHWSLQKYGHLPAWVAFYCARILPESTRSIVLERAEWEMVLLFTRQWNQQDEQEVPLTLPNKAQRRYSFRPQNTVLPAASVTWPDPLKSTKLWKKLSQKLVALFNGSQSELRPYGLMLGREGITRQHRLAWEALPVVLQNGEHPSRKKLLELGGSTLEETGYATTTVGAVAKILDIAQRGALSPQLSRGISQTLQYCGLGIEPDARLSGKSYLWDDGVVLFSALPSKLGPVDDAVVARYQSSAGFLRFALYVAQAAGTVAPETVEIITQRLFEILQLLPMEKRRAKVLANHLARHPIVLTGHKLPAEAMESWRVQLSSLLLEVVAQSGQVNAAQEAALGTVWKRLGLEKRKLTQELDELSARGVVFIGDRVAGRPGEILPPPPIGASPTVAFELDHAVIGALLEDTAHVHRALHEAMGVEEEVGSQNAEGKREETAIVEVEAPVTFAGLAPGLSGFLTALLQQPQWEKAEAQELARSHDTMLAGAIEKINDWAFEELGEQLIFDDGDAVSVEEIGEVLREKC